MRIDITNAGLPLPASRDECSVVSVGRRDDGEPLRGNQASQLFNNALRSGLVRPADAWRPLGEQPSYSYRFGDSALFAVAARRRDSKSRSHDIRHLTIIPEAVSETLSEVQAAGFRVVHLGSVASGRDRLWHPLHPFAQTLRGIRKFIVHSPHSC